MLNEVMQLNPYHARSREMLEELGYEASETVQVVISLELRK